MSVKFLTIPQKNLAKSITSTSMSFKLNNIKSWKTDSLGRKIDLSASDFGTQAYGAFRNDTGTILEIFEFDPSTIANTNITILKRGLEFDGDLTTETTAYKLDLPAGTVVHLGTDTPQLFQYLKEYIDGIAIAGSPDATETSKGIVEEATQAEVNAGTATGGTGARLFVPPDKLLSMIGSYITIETTAGTTHSLTTTAGQKVIVWVSGQTYFNGDIGTKLSLKYNGVTKHEQDMRVAGTSDNFQLSFALEYTETPGAGTHDITVITSTGSITNVKIIVIKIGI